MSQLLQIPNFAQANLSEMGQFKKGVAPGDTTAQVVNSQNFDANTYLYLGTLGSETGEIVSVKNITAPDGVVLNDPGVQFKHVAGEQITKLFGMFIVIYRAPANATGYPNDSDFSKLTTVSIDSDQPLTEVVDQNGGVGFWYKFTYSNGTNETNISNSVAKRGGNTTDYCTLADIREESGFKNNRTVTDGDIDSSRTQAQEYINGALVGAYTVPFTSPINAQIQRITIVLAAGYLQLQQHGAFRTANTANGQARIDWAIKELEKIQNGQQQLLDPSGNSMQLPGSSGIGYQEDMPGQIFTIDSLGYGDTAREY